MEKYDEKIKIQTAFAEVLRNDGAKTEEEWKEEKRRIQIEARKVKNEQKRQENEQKRRKIEAQRYKVRKGKQAIEAQRQEIVRATEDIKVSGVVVADEIAQAIISGKEKRVVTPEVGREYMLKRKEKGSR